MAGHGEPVMMQKRGSSGLSATLAAAGLADPDILALAQEADTLVYHSKMAQDGTPMNAPAELAGIRKTVGPPAAHSTSPRPHRSAGPTGKPVVLPTAGTGYAGRTSPIPGKGPSPIYGSKRTVSNSYALSLSRSNSNAGKGSAAPSRSNSSAGHKGGEIRAETNHSSSAGYKPNVSATVSAYNAAARSTTAQPRSRNNSNAGYAVSSSPSRSNSAAGNRKPGNISNFSVRTGGAIGSKIPSSSAARGTVSAFAAASGAGDDSSSKVILHSNFSIGHDDSMARSASMEPSGGGAAPNAGSIGAFPNTLHRRTASLPCWPNESTAVSTAASAMEVELEEAFVAAVASGENFSSDDGLEITLASPPAANMPGNSASIPSMTSSLERAQLAGAREVEYAAAAAAVASHKSSDEMEMSGSYSSSVVVGGGYAATSSSNYSSAASRALGYSSSSSGGSPHAAATPKAGAVGSVASSMFVANPRQAAQPASLLNIDDYSSSATDAAAAANSSGGSNYAAIHSSSMTYKPAADHPADQTLDCSAPGAAFGGSYAEGLRQRSGNGIAPAAAAATLAAADEDCQQQSSVFDVSYQLGGKLPVLTEELHEKGSAASSLTNTGATNTGGGAGGSWWNLSSRRVHPQQSNNTSRGGADESSNQQEQDLSRKSNSLSRNSTQSEHTNTNTARASNAGGKTEKRVSEISVYTENALDPEALKSGSKSRKRWLCLLLPLLLLLSATGVFVGLYVTKQLQPKAAAAGGGPLTFQVTVAAPARTASESCDIWFGSSERAGLYKRLFASAYSNALALPLTDTTVNSVSCGGNNVFSSTGIRSLRNSRALLQAAAAAAAGTSGSALTWVDITTVFSVSAPADARAQKEITDTVSSSSSGILAGPLSQFLGVNTLLVKASGAVKETPASSTASAPNTAGSDWPQVPVLAVDEKPETGALAADSAAAATDKPSLTQSNQRTSGTEEPKQPVEVVSSTPDQPSKKQQQQQQQPKRKQQPSQSSVATAAAASAEPTELQLSSFAWNLLAADAVSTAPTCPFSPTRRNSVSDSQGRLWSLTTGKECTFKPAPAAARKAAEAVGAEINWEGSPLCTAAPTRATAVADAAGNLWGFEEGSSCAYKNEDGASLKLKNKPASLPVVWEQAPICDFAPTRDNSTSDVLGRMWGVDNQGRGCTFRFVEA